MANSAQVTGGFCRVTSANGGQKHVDGIHTSFCLEKILSLIWKSFKEFTQLWKWLKLLTLLVSVALTHAVKATDTNRASIIACLCYRYSESWQAAFPA